MNRKQVLIIVIIAFFVGTIGSVFFNRIIFPNLASVNGFGWVAKFQSNSSVVINRREEVRLNEGVNLIELTKQAQTITVSIFSTGINPKYLGNGIVISADGIIFTTKDVVGANPTVSVVLDDGMVYVGTVRAMDPKSPLVALTIPAQNLPVAQLSNAVNMQTAQRVFSLGKTTQEYNRQFVSGLITKTLDNHLDYSRVLNTEIFENTFTTDAHINADFIGGPVVNLQGLMVGMATGADGQILPAEVIDGAVRSYLQTGKITRPYIGMEYLMFNKSVAKLKNLSVGGAQVVVVVVNSPAAKSGLLVNDLIIEVNSQKIENSSLEQVLLEQNASQYTLKVMRAGAETTVTLVPEIK